MLVYFGIKLILERCSKELDLELKDLLKRFQEPKWQDEERTSMVIDDCIQVSCDIILSDYRNRLEHPDFIHRNWLRQITTLDRLKSQLLDRQFVINQIKTKFT